MYRLRLLLLGAVLALAACRIEPTPRDFIDRSGPIAEEREAARDELRTFLFAFTNAIDRGDAAGAAAALAPAPDAWLVGPDADEPLERAEFAAAAVRAAGAAARRYELAPGDVRVAVDPRAQTGWFVVRLAPAAGDGVAAPAPTLWMSGVYRRRADAWELVQAQLSRVLPDAAAAPASDSVSAAAPSPNRAAGAARSE